MTSPTRRDEAWHAIIATATETGHDDVFGAEDVISTARDNGLEVASRTVRKTLRVMVEWDYLEELGPGDYQLTAELEGVA